MNSYVIQIYNGAAMLPVITQDKMERHMLRTSLWRIQVALGDLPPTTEEDEAAAAYMAGYEDESE